MCSVRRWNWRLNGLSGVRLILLMILSPIGYALLRYDWPRPPFVIGIVLGSIA